MRERAPDVVFTETVGTPGGNSTVAAYTGWSNNGSLIFTGSGDVRNNTFSDYAGASAAGNVLLNSGMTADFQISSINTSAYVNSFTLSFGALKTTPASSMSEMALAYSSDGTNYTPITIPAQATGTGTAVWRVITLSNITLASVPNLRLRWTNTSTGSSPDFRLDDITLSGVAAVPEASSLLFGGLASCVAAALRVKRRRRWGLA